ncbi:MAG: carbohydrate ABC transporter permease [Anaerolineae bacterium]|nr:carbohydrate ABC transporter permease [Anaerolineae bacterium]
MQHAGSRSFSLVRLTSYAYLALIGVFAIFPFYWMLINSLKAPNEVFAIPPTYFPSEVSFDSYTNLFASNSMFPRNMLNSFIVATSTAVLATLIATMAGYSFSKFRFPGNRPISYSLFLTQMFPVAAILVPLFIIFQRLGLYNTLGALILAGMAFSVPVAIWLMIGFFDAIPSELIDAALIDGASQIGVLFRIILPISVNGIVATTMYIFISAWSELLFAVTFTSSRELATLPVALSNFTGQYGTDWTGMMAASVLTALPVAIIFLSLQRFFVEGITSGAVKN